MKDNYDDIIDLPHHVSANHPQMPMEGRAAQFAPFAALTGYDAAIRETARLTDSMTVDETLADMLDRKISLLREHVPCTAEVSITFFVPDTRKQGGKHITVSGRVKGIDDVEKALKLADGRIIPLRSITDIQGEMLECQ